MEGQEAGGDEKPDALKRSFVAQALAIVRAKKWRVYQGHVSTQVALGGSNFVYFFWWVNVASRLFIVPVADEGSGGRVGSYNGLKAALLKRLRTRNQALSGAISPMQNLALSCLAGVINVYITAPLWVMNMRLKSKDHAKYTGMLGACTALPPLGS